MANKKQPYNWRRVYSHPRDTQAPLDSGTDRARMFHPSIHEGTKAPHPQYNYAGGGF